MVARATALPSFRAAPDASATGRVRARAFQPCRSETPTGDVGEPRSSAILVSARRRSGDLHAHGREQRWATTSRRGAVACARARSATRRLDSRHATSRRLRPRPPGLAGVHDRQHRECATATVDSPTQIDRRRCGFGRRATDLARVPRGREPRAAFDRRVRAGRLGGARPPRSNASSSTRATSSSKPMPGRLGGLGEQARLGQARDRVRLEHVQLAAGVEHQVHAREAVAAEQPVGPSAISCAPVGRPRPAARPGTRTRCGRSRSAPRSRRSPRPAGTASTTGSASGRRADRDRQVAARRRGARAARCRRRRRRPPARRARRRRCART